MENREKHKVVIIGAGVAGMTCALYLARAAIDVCLIGDWTTTPLLSSPTIKNYPGLYETSGQEYLSTLNDQVLAAGVRVIAGTAATPMRADEGWIVYTDTGNVVEIENLVIATGSSSRMLNLKNEEQFIGNGVSTCAYCDGPLYKDKKVCVIGSGTLAVEQAMYLSKICSSVTVFCRKDKLSSTVYTPDNLAKYTNVSIMFNAPIQRVYCEKGKTFVYIGEGRPIMKSFDGVFYAMGSIPNTSFLEGLCPLDKNGYIDLPDEVAKQHHMYACGDVNASNKYKQVVTAAADGCRVALQLLQDIRAK